MSKKIILSINNSIKLKNLPRLIKEGSLDLNKQYNFNSTKINNSNNSIKYTILMYACITRNEDIINLLFTKYFFQRTYKFNIDIDIQNNIGRTALIYASITGNSEIVKILCKNNANINIQDHDGKTALIYASISGNSEIVNILCKKNIEIDIQDHDGKTALIYASISGNSEIVNILCKKNIEIDIQDHDGKTALIYASIAGNSEIVKILCKNNANINIKYHDGKTALIYASIAGNSEIVKILCKKKIEIDIQDHDGKTAFIHACINAPIIKYTNEHTNEHINAYTNANIAKANNYSKVVKILCENIALNTKQDNDGKTALMYAIIDEKEYIIYNLFHNCSSNNPNLVDKDGRSVLIHACIKGNFRIVQYLYGIYGDSININIIDINKKSALNYAYDNKKYDIFESLCYKKGVNIPDIMYNINDLKLKNILLNHPKKLK